MYETQASRQRSRVDSSSQTLHTKFLHVVLAVLLHGFELAFERVRTRVLDLYPCGHS